VCWQAAENLTVWFSQWRAQAALGEVAERHTRLTVKLLSTYTVLDNKEGSGDLSPTDFIPVVNCRGFIFFKLNCKDNNEIKPYFL
jgi:hypothetical protein